MPQMTDHLYVSHRMEEKATAHSWQCSCNAVSASGYSVAKSMPTVVILQDAVTFPDHHESMVAQPTCQHHRITHAIRNISPKWWVIYFWCEEHGKTACGLIMSWKRRSTDGAGQSSASRNCLHSTFPHWPMSATCLQWQCPLIAGWV